MILQFLASQNSPPVENTEVHITVYHGTPKNGMDRDDKNKLMIYFFLQINYYLGGRTAIKGTQSAL